MLVLILLVGTAFVASTRPAFAHEAEEETWFIVPYYSGDLRLETDHFAVQWNGGRELVFESAWEHEISMVALNNGTHVYFHVRWADPTNSPDENDGVAIYFEGAGIDGSDSLWVWSSNSSQTSGAGVAASAMWKDDFWNVAFGRTLAAPSEGNANLRVGESKEDFLKVAVWDGTQGQSLEQIDSETIPHLNVDILPYLDYYPRDSFVWLTILGIGLVAFTYKELKLIGWRKKE